MTDTSRDTTTPRPDPASLTGLAEVRAGIDAIDGALLTLLAERQAHVDRAATLKAGAGIAAAAPARAAAVLERVHHKAGQAGVDPHVAVAMWRVMIDHFIRREQATLGTTGEDA
ncbi:chorismate mutase [Pseudooceanicola aestuarii]|uniref:chorismate mutase n=1 Tax=Pseudooceanicola aestuarii TaxID=2697319 RepID=UPI0013CF7348|nr:chorismate mutase [Pseudooceanicola aestuarii]